MQPFLNLIGAGSTRITPVVQIVTSSPGSWQSLIPPVGAVEAMIENIGSGCGGAGGGSGISNGGGGGAFAKTNAASLAGLTAVALRIGAPGLNGYPGTSTEARANSSTGTVLCSAAAAGLSGGQASACVGDVKVSGENGFSASYGIAQGGAAAGPNGLGVAPAGARQTTANGAGLQYGGGGTAWEPGDGSSGTGYPGYQGWARITWS